MPTVGDYSVVRDVPKAFGQPGGDPDESYTFDVPPNLNRSRRAVATWRFGTITQPDAMEWRVSINGTPITTLVFGDLRFGEVYATLQEVFDGALLHPGTNTARIEILSGSGSFDVSDFVVHFQVDV